MTDIAANAGKAKPAPRAMEAEKWDADAGFYLTMVVVAALVVFLGFAPSFYLKSVIHAPPPLSQLTIAHGVAFTAWMLLFITQVTLIARRQPALHRQLGILGAILFGAMVPLAISTAITAGRLGHAPPGAPAPLAFMALPLFAIVAVLILVTTALWNRRRPDWHKRLMLASVFIMTGPATGRLAIPLGLAQQGTTIALGFAEFLLAIALLYDYRVHKRVHDAYWVAAVVLVAVHIGVIWAFGSPTWLAFAQALTQT